MIETNQAALKLHIYMLYATDGRGIGVSGSNLILNRRANIFTQIEAEDAAQYWWERRSTLQIFNLRH